MPENAAVIQRSYRKEQTEGGNAIVSADNETYLLLAPVDGIVVAIRDVPDPVFSREALGPGIALEPLGAMLCAPAAGKVIQCARTSHALTLELAPGVDILLHLGLDTVHLDGKGLQMLVHEGEHVSAGMPLIRFDVDEVAQGATSLITPLVLTGSRKFHVAVLASGRISAGEPLVRLVPVTADTALPPDHDSAPVTTAQEQAEIALENGLHARPASRLRQIGERHRAKIVLQHNNQEADAGHLTALLDLGLMPDDRVQITVTGPHARETADEVKKFLETPEGISSALIQPPVKKQNSGDKGVLHGVTASPGLGIGVLQRLTLLLPPVAEQGKGHDAEKNDLLDALDRLRKNLQQAVRSSGKATQQADILAAHIALLDDDELTGRALDLIASDKSAAAAWKTTLDERIAGLARSVNPLIRERTGDLYDLQFQLISLLHADPSEASGTSAAFANAPELANAVVVADDLTPSQMIALADIGPAGICLAAGGTTSHVAILCREAGIPCLAGLGRSVLDPSLFRGQTVILDATRGVMDPAPSDRHLRQAGKQAAEQLKMQQNALSRAMAPAMSRDGTVIHVSANITGATQAGRSLAMGADAVGLFRTEFLFLGRDEAPSAEEQEAHYQQAVDAMQGKPVIIRMIDIGADKQLAWLDTGTCPNPAMGMRGVRLLDTCPDLMETQLRALLRVRTKPLADGRSALKIMLPMVTDTSDIIRIRVMMDRLAGQMKLKKRKDFLMPQLGVMVEVPAAALVAGELAAVADFFSIGTNDLAQYCLAIDREEPQLGRRLDILHPALLRLISLCCDAARKYQCPVGVCGTAAGDDIAGPVLAAFGVTELSVEPQKIADVKARLGRINLRTLRAEAEKAAGLADAAEARKALATCLKSKHGL